MGARVNVMNGRAAGSFRSYEAIEKQMADERQWMRIYFGGK
jgi:hypothetical protein